MKREYRNTARTKRMIKAAFGDLLSSKKSIEKITVSELAEKADIAKSTFYNHYDDVYAVAEEFENDILCSVSAVLDEIEKNSADDYEPYISKLIDFMKINEDLYRKVISSGDVRFFIDKLKVLISKKIFTESTVLPFSKHANERIVQIHLLTNACVDTVTDYFRGMFDISLDEVGRIILDFFDRLREQSEA
ncbi:MAG: TetR/AcrR family transcriptional regulator C-terminal domain-containing protein [Clostridia bacterium]|nr:TetR/AcrR family transcriptional regulator C-terminal domain-containing protein [Clostridia bacterium]